METNKDLILRNLKYFSDFLINLTKQKPLELDIIDSYLDEFLLENYNINTKSILTRKLYEIIEIIEVGNSENIRDFADILFIKYTLEVSLTEKKELSILIINLYEYYQVKSATYSFEIQSKINTLKSILN